jgi:hypothetical protein
MKPLPTDLEVLDAIYERYYPQFVAATGKDKIYIAIDIEAIARGLAVDPDIVFGRLYYHLTKKFSYHQDDGTRVPFFTLGAFGQPGKHHVQFPLLASVLADLRADDKRHRTTNWLSLWALALSLAAIIVSVFVKD